MPRPIYSNYGVRCGCGHRDHWRVTMYRHNRSAFNGYHYTPSDYSEILCDRDDGGCGAFWRTKAQYVETLPGARA